MRQILLSMAFLLSACGRSDIDYHPPHGYPEARRTVQVESSALRVAGLYFYFFTTPGTNAQAPRQPGYLVVNPGYSGTPSGEDYWVGIFQKTRADATAGLRWRSIDAFGEYGPAASRGLVFYVYRPENRSERGFSTLDQADFAVVVGDFDFEAPVLEGEAAVARYISETRTRLRQQAHHGGNDAAAKP
jgi:hypothetical protein